MKQLKEDLKNQTFHPVYLLYGEEDYLKRMYRDRLKKAVLGDGDEMNYSYFEGKDIDFPDKMGVIIENPGFLPSYNAFFNLKILSRVSGKAADEHIRKVITEMGLDPDNLKPVGQYSLGMRGRLGIAQAIMENPDYLILDEPFNGLDQDGVEDVHQLLQKLKKEGKLFHSTKGEGHGFGLVRMDAIVERLDGYISRNSEDGAFTTEILLPQI